VQKTGIEWTDQSWNPVTGCKHNCDYCYARDIHHRFGRTWEPTFHPNRLQQPRKKKKSLMIFVCSMADLFGSWVPQIWIDAVLNEVVNSPQHIFQFLTKNPERLLEQSWPENSWVGASTTTKKQMERAMAVLPNVKANVRFISAEPLLEPVRQTKHIEWTIIGAQTGRGAHQPPVEWVNNLSADARKFGSSLFYKPNLNWSKPPREYPLKNEREMSFQFG